MSIGALAMHVPCGNGFANFERSRVPGKENLILAVSGIEQV